MKKNKTGMRKPAAIVLALFLCAALMPFSSFAAAEELPENDLQNEGGQVTVMEDEETSEEVSEEAAAETEEATPEEEEPLTTIQSEPAAADAECVHELEVVAQEPATCQHSGVKAHRVCTKCGAIFDYKENKEVDYKDLIIPVADHKWDSGKVISKATASKNGKMRYTCTVCGSYYDEPIYYVPTPAQAKSFSLNGKKLTFKTKVVKSVPSFMKSATVSRLWIKAGKSQIKLNWKLAKNMKVVDGIIILRKTGSAKTYTEIKRIAFKKYEKGIAKWSPSTTFTDKTAKKKNTPYTYVIVSYYDEGDYTYISNCSDWAAGQVTTSKLKNAYSAKISRKSAALQYKGKVKLTLKHSKPKKIYSSKSFRWYSDNTKVAKVSSKGVVTATGVGSTTIRGRLPSGYDVTCKVSVVGAFKPSTPKLKVDVASNSSISLVWTKAKNATSYELYRSDDGLHWKSPVRVTGTSKKVTGLTKGHRYTFYVIARNDNNGYVAKGNNSNVIYQKAVIKRRPTTLSGWPTSKSLTNGKSYSVSVKIGTPDGRKAKLQMKNGKTWVTKKTISLPKGAQTSKVTISFPNSWWGSTTSWRLYIPRCNTSTEYTTKTLTIKASRNYQNPSGYVQISDSLTSHGYGYYISPVLVNSTSTRANHVEALIKTAGRYKGNKYVNGRSGAPGNGIDASGLVIQACYGAGVDLWPISPSTRPSNCVPKIMNSKLGKRTYTDDHRYMIRGDLVFFYTGRNLIGHVAIYLGYGKILHASMVTGVVETSTIDELIKPVKDGGKYGYSVAGVRRIFN